MSTSRRQQGSATTRSCLKRFSKSLLNILMKPAVSENDTNDEYVRKLAVVVAITGATVAGAVVFTGTYLTRGFVKTLLNYSILFAVFSSVSAYVYISRVKRVSNALIWALAVVWSVLVVSGDLLAASAYQPRMWPLFVVIIDVLLVCNVGTAATVRYVWFVAFWLTLTSVESGFRFGLYDIPGLAPREQREEMVECANPPCKLTPWMQTLAGTLYVFTLDFLVTRGFAARLREQTAALSESVEVAGRIAQHLAAYDLESAEADLRKAGRLPPEMSYELENLLRNLKSYRPFLPYALFRQRDDGGGGGGAGGEGVNERAPTTAASTAEVDSVVSLTSADGCRPTDSPPRSPAGGPTKSNDFTIVRQMRLEPKRVSLLGVFLRRPQALSGETVGEYVTKHTAALSTVFAAVTRQRGSLDHFQGDHVFASYNAFGTAINHALGAMNASMVVVKEAQAKCAVVSGEVFAGYLGTATVRSPSIVGKLPSLLGQAMEAASVVKEDMVCCGETAQSSMFAVALRLLLHRFWLRRGDERTTLLWTMEGSHSPVVYAEEWMYEVEENGSLAWSHYNDAARMHHVHGNVAALSHARNGLLNAQMHQRFIEESQSALWVDLRVRQTTLAAAPAVAAKDNVPPPDISMETC